MPLINVMDADIARPPPGGTTAAATSHQWSSMETKREHGRRLTVVGVAVAVTGAAIFVPAFRLHVVSSSGGAIVVTLRGMALLFTAALAAQRFARTASRLDAAVGISLGVLAVADVGFSLDRAALVTDQASAPQLLPYVVAGALVLAIGACRADRALMRRPSARLVALWCASIVLLVFIAQEIGLVPGGRITFGPDATENVVLRFLGGALFAVSAVALAVLHRRDNDVLIRWLVPALALSALAQLERVAVGSPPAPELTWAQVLQVGGAAALLVGCIGEVRTYHHRLTEMAVSDERRRIARDLHDGVAQDVAFIVSQTKRLNERAHDERLALVTSAAERALADSRCIVGALTRSSAQPLSASIAMQAREFARRWGLEVDVATHDDMAVAPEKQEAVLRIVGEALSNAARHSQATRVHIEVAAPADGPLRVAVTDDGRGFDTLSQERSPASGFGLRSMRERAQLVGGDVALMSEPGHGTRVEIAIP
jgi:signal transduction histidine kinase